MSEDNSDDMEPCGDRETHFVCPTRGHFLPTLRCECAVDGSVNLPGGAVTYPSGTLGHRPASSPQRELLFLFPSFFTLNTSLKLLGTLLESWRCPWKSPLCNFFTLSIPLPHSFSPPRHETRAKVRMANLIWGMVRFHGAPCQRKTKGFARAVMPMKHVHIFPEQCPLLNSLKRQERLSAYISLLQPEMEVGDKVTSCEAVSYLDIASVQQ